MAIKIMSPIDGRMVSSIPQDRLQGGARDGQQLSHAAVGMRKSPNFGKPSIWYMIYQLFYADRIGMPEFVVFRPLKPLCIDQVTISATTAYGHKRHADNLIYGVWQCGERIEEAPDEIKIAGTPGSEVWWRPNSTSHRID